MTLSDIKSLRVEFSREHTINQELFEYNGKIFLVNILMKKYQGECRIEKKEEKFWKSGC